MQMLLNRGHLGPAKILSESSVKMMGENNIGSIFVEVQAAADQSLTKPFPLGAGEDKFGLGFQIASSDPRYTRFRSAGSMSWAGIYNTEFWIDPVQDIGVVYDDAGAAVLRRGRHPNAARLRGVGVPERAIAEACGQATREHIRSRVDAKRGNPFLQADFCTDRSMSIWIISGFSANKKLVCVSINFPLARDSLQWRGR